MRHPPNAITLLRLALVPVIAALLYQDRHGEAFGCFVVYALSLLLTGVFAVLAGHL